MRIVGSTGTGNYPGYSRWMNDKPVLIDVKGMFNETDVKDFGTSFY